MSTQNESPFACDLTKLLPAQKKRVLELVEILKRQIQKVTELENGYEFHLESSTEMIQNTGEFISYERLCCPFFDFHLFVEREGGSVRLSLFGRPGVKEFIRFEFGLDKI